jgi:hypothetical protein
MLEKICRHRSGRAPTRKKRLRERLHDISRNEQYEAETAAFEPAYRAKRPWVYQPAPSDSYRQRGAIDARHRRPESGLLGVPAWIPCAGTQQVAGGGNAEIPSGGVTPQASSRFSEP